MQGQGRGQVAEVATGGNHLGLFRRHANMALIDAQVLGALGAWVLEGVGSLEGGHLSRRASLRRLIVDPIELNLVPLLTNTKRALAPKMTRMAFPIGFPRKWLNEAPYAHLRGPHDPGWNALHPLAVCCLYSGLHLCPTQSKSHLRWPCHRQHSCAMAEPSLALAPLSIHSRSLALYPFTLQL